MSLSTQPNALSPCEVLNAKDPIAKLTWDTRNDVNVSYLCYSQKWCPIRAKWAVPYEQYVPMSPVPMSCPYEHYPHVTCPFWAIHMSPVPMSPVPMSTIVHKIETLLYLWNSDLCYFRQPKTLHLHLRPTSFVLRPTSILRPTSYVHPTSYIHRMSYANMSILCPTLICPSYVLR
jgi:hypothetical protein